MTGQVFDSLGQFYDDRPERRTSGESDYGVHWRFGGRAWPEWRVSYIQATGEVYAFRQAGREPGAVRVLAVIPPDPDTRHETGDFSSGKTYYRTVDRILDGWAEYAHGHDLAWIENRLAGYPATAEG